MCDGVCVFVRVCVCLCVCVCLHACMLFGFASSRGCCAGAECLVGSYCIGGSAPAVACGAAGSWCPLKSSTASGTSCDAGYFGTAAGAPSYTAGTCAGACTCVAGSFCAAGSTSAAGSACPVGSFCAGGPAAPSPCGAAGARRGASCTGASARGDVYARLCFCALAACCGFDLCQIYICICICICAEVYVRMCRTRILVPRGFSVPDLVGVRGGHVWDIERRVIVHIFQLRRRLLIPAGLLLRGRVV